MATTATTLTPWDTEWKRTAGWKVTRKGDGGRNPWNVDPATPDILTFDGDGNGGADDVIKKNGTIVGNQITYTSNTSSNDTARVWHPGTSAWYKFTRSSSTMTCDKEASGSRSWTAVEG